METPTNIKDSTMTEDEILQIFDIGDKTELYLLSENPQYKNIKYRKLDRDDCIMLLYNYRKNNSHVSYAILFEEIFIIFKRNLSNKKFKTLSERSPDGGISYTEDFYQDYFLIFDKIVTEFVMVTNHSFKKYSDKIVKGQINKLIKEKYFFVYNKPIGVNAYEVNESLANDLQYDYMETIPDPTDLEESIIEKINEKKVEGILNNLVQITRLKKEDIEMFCLYHGILSEQLKQVEIATKYGLSPPTVCKKIAKVKEVLSKEKYYNLLQSDININLEKRKQMGRVAYY